MSLNPESPSPLTHDGRTAERLADLERRMAQLERGAATIQAGTAAPTSTPRDGTVYAQNSGTGFLWVRIGGVWRKVGVA